MSSSRAASRSISLDARWTWTSRPSSWCLRSRAVPRRSQSIARCLPVPMSQAPGLSGAPDSGHWSSAAMSASWARSSATPTSRTIRASPAMSRGDSIRQTASMARWASEDGTVLPVVGRLGAQALLLLAQLRGELVAEIVGREHRADLELGLLHGRSLDPLDRLVQRLGLDQPETREQLLGLRERAVDHLTLREADAHALGAGMEPLAGEHHAGVGQLLVVLAHLGEHLLAGP